MSCYLIVDPRRTVTLTDTREKKSAMEKGMKADKDFRYRDIVVRISLIGYTDKLLVTIHLFVEKYNTILFFFQLYDRYIKNY